MSHLTTHDHLSFLHRLATDDAFRSALVADPRAVLTRSGITLPADLPAEVALPAKAALAAELPEAPAAAPPWAHAPN